MDKLKYLNCSLPGGREDANRQFEDCSTSMEQIIHCIETVEAQLREKRQTIEEIRARHKVLADELALAVSDLGNVLPAHDMLSDDTSIDPEAVKAGFKRVLDCMDSKAAQQ